MIARRLARGEPDPIDAEFEQGERARPRGPARRSRNVTLLELTGGCIGAAFGGALIAIAVAGTGSGANTGPLSVDLGSLKRNQAELSRNGEQAGNDLVQLRARIDAQADRIRDRENADLALRQEIAAVSGQLSALAGSGDGASPVASAAGNSPLGKLITRMDRLEQIADADARAPQTAPQMQRALRDLSDRISALDDANTTLAEALNHRAEAVTALERQLAEARNEIAALRPAGAAPGAPAGSILPQALAAAAPAPLVTAGAGARIEEALVSLDSAARRSAPFPAQQRVVAGLLPGNADIAALGPISRTGAPTLEQLRREFETVATGMEAREKASADDGWNFMRTTVNGVALERPVDHASLARARQALAAGDLKSAIAAAGAEPFRAWRFAAGQRADLDARLATLLRR